MADATAPPTGAWKDGECNCCSQWVPTCCAAYWCAPCLTARFYDQFYKRGSYWWVLVALIGLSVLQVIFDNLHKSEEEDPSSGAYIAFTIIFIVVGVSLLVLYTCFIWRARAKARQRFNIEGTDMKDCCCSFWCSCCVLAQLYRHVKPTRGCCDDCDCAGLCAVPENEVFSNTV